MNWGDFREKQTLSGVNMEDKQSTQYEQLCALKRTRGGYASHVTRKYRTVREMIDQRRDVTVIRDIFDEFKGAFDRFEKSHYECSQLAAGDRRCKEQTWAVQLGGLKKIKTDAKLNLGGTYKVI